MAKQNLKLYRGTTYNMNYTHTSAMTGGTVYFTVKSLQSDTDATDAAAVIKKTVTTFTGSNLIASWVLNDADTYITPNEYQYDIVYEDATKLSLPPIFEGTLTILPHPTNRNVGNE